MFAGLSATPAGRCWILALEVTVVGWGCGAGVDLSPPDNHPRPQMLLHLGFATLNIGRSFFQHNYKVTWLLPKRPISRQPRRHKEKLLNWGICFSLRSGAGARKHHPGGNHLHLRVCKWPMVWCAMVCYIYGSVSGWWYLKIGPCSLTLYTTDSEHWLVNEERNPGVGKPMEEPVIC